VTAPSGDELTGRVATSPLILRYFKALQVWSPFCHLPLFVAEPASEARCHDWEAVKRALHDEQEIAYEFDRRHVHVWTGHPKRGDRCKCGARAWA